MNWLLRLRPWHFLLLSMLLVEVLTALMSILFHGRVSYDYLISGALVSFIVASLMIYLFSLSSRLQFEKDLLEKEIIERKRAQHELNRIFELSYDLICTATMTHFVRINPAGEKILGYTQKELQDIPFIDLIHPDDVEPTSQAIENELKKGRAVICFRNRYRNKDGHYRWLEWMTHPDLEDNMLYAVARDITERRKVEEDLLLLKRSVEMISTGITISDLDGRIHYTNPAEAKMHGYSVEELIGGNVNNFMPEGKKDANTGAKTFEEVSKWKEWSREIEEVRSDGTVFPVHLRSLPVTDPMEETVYIITTSEDITERKQSEKKLKQALDEKEMLMREVHHRTKNNLSVVAGLLKLQARQIGDESAAASLKDTANRVRTMSIVHEKLYNMRDLSRLDIREYMDSLATDLFFSFGIEPSRIKLQVNIPELSLDLDHLIPVGLIVNELVTNSLKYAFPEEREGEVLIGLEETGGNEFELTVRDNGIGLPEGFDISEVKTLGLQIVRSLVTQIHGQLEAVRDNGTMFRITFKGKS